MITFGKSTGIYNVPKRTKLDIVEIMYDSLCQIWEQYRGFSMVETVESNHCVTCPMIIHL